MTCPTCYVNATPEPAAVVVTNNAITIAIDSANVTWVVDRFTVAGSVGGLGAAFFLSKAAAVASQVQVWLDNTYQEPPTLLTAGMFTVSNVRDKVTLNGFTIGAGEVLVIRYLGYVAAVSLADISDDPVVWVNDTFVLSAMTGGGKICTLSKAALSAAGIVVLINNVEQAPTTYTVSAGLNRVTFGSAITTQTVIIRYMAYA